MKCLLWLTSNCGYLGEIVSALKNNNHQIIVLLALDGVFLLDKGCKESSILKQLGTEVYAIQEHVEERGLRERLVVKPTFVDYPTAVNLVMEGCERVISL